MKYLFLTISILCCFSSFAQETFNQFYINPYRESGSGSVGTSVEVWGDTIYVFTRIVDEDLSTIGYMLKYDFNGQVVDSIRFVSPDPTLNVDLGEFGDVQNDNGDFVFPWTEYEETQPELAEYYLSKTETNGNQIFKKSVVVDINRRHYYQKVTSHDGGYGIIGHITDSLNSSTYAEISGLLTHTDIDGNLLWYQTYDNISELYFASPTSDGGLLLGGMDFNGGSLHEHCILKIDNLGNELWRKNFETGEYGSPITPVLELMDGSYLACGTHIGLEGFGFARGPFLLKKFDNNGDTIMTKEWDFRDTGKNFRGVKQLEDSSLVLIGYNGEFLGEDGPGELEWSHNQGYFAKLSQDLDSIWSHFYTIDASIIPGGFDDMVDFDIMPDGGFVITGTIHRAPNDTLFPGATQMWLLRLDAFGCLEPGCQYVGIEEINIGLENTMMVYPNPIAFGGEINIRFSPQGVAEMPYVKKETLLAVYDALGREFHRQDVPATGSNDAFDILLNIPELAKGNYSIQWYSDKWFDAVQFNYE